MPTRAQDVSPKVMLATVGGAVSTIFWTVADGTFWHGVFSTATMVTLTTATTAVLTFVIGYLVPDPGWRRAGRS
ncbi:hypothetical protein JOF56_010721 [Kibdelosporangium banguiense]|uniref:Holin n=1 Tax=Kibdelosporangium banguiense TaxID=1365924 RepID=A0ABS4U133_9PSEU|nr:hypothetical protein [Kibdelosporangium banguiense]MBP2330336.1 hypothetical protein [Kibdelosporangium banguiense]